MLKAIIVDDDVTTLNGLKKAVNWKKLNMEVVGTAVNGKEGLELIEQSDPDLILTDIYMPVIDGIEMLKALRQKNQDAEVIILSGYEDFKYAQSAFKLKVLDYISKPATIDEIESVLWRATDIIQKKNVAEKEERELRDLFEANLPWAKKQLFKGLLEPNQVQSSYMSKVMEYLQIDLANCWFNVIIIEFLKDGERLNYKWSEWPLFSYAVNNMIEEVIGAKKGCYIADVQLNNVTLILSASSAHSKKERLEKRANEISEQILQHIHQFLKLNAWAAIGSTVDSAGQIHRSYLEAMNLMEERHHLVDKRIITKDVFNVKPRTLPRRPIESYHSMAEAAVQGQRELVAQKIQDYMEALRSASDLTVGMLREFAIDFIGVIVRALYDHGLRIEDLNANDNPYKRPERIFSKEDLTLWMKEILLSACDLTDKRVSSKHKKTIDFIIRFVGAHYAEDITLDTIADKVYLTRNYLSQIFKQATGENYNNYLTRIRMEKAKELMMTGNYKLYEISQMVGYKNNAYFSQLFKKYTGYNPSEFNQS